MNCINCGEVLEIGEKFCGNCGVERKLPPVFIETEKKFQQLKESKNRREMGESEFVTALEKLVVEDGGVYWMIGADSGEWYRHDGEEWVRAEPPQAQTAPQIQTTRKPVPAGQAGQQEPRSPMPPPQKKESSFPWMWMVIGGGLLGVTILVAGLFLGRDIFKSFNGATMSIDTPGEDFGVGTLPAGEPTEFLTYTKQAQENIPNIQTGMPTGTASSPAVQQTSTGPTNDQGFFVQEFDDKRGIEEWEDMTYADSNYGEIDTANSIFNIHILKPQTLTFFSFGEDILPASSRDYEVFATFLPPSNKYGGVGVICRLNEDKGWYYAGANPQDNQYMMGRYDAPTPQLPLIVSDYSFNQGGPNDMTLTCNGNRISLTINGRAVDDFEDNTLGSGLAAIYAVLYGGVPEDPDSYRFRATFDDVAVMKKSNE